MEDFETTTTEIIYRRYLKNPTVSKFLEFDEYTLREMWAANIASIEVKCGRVPEIPEHILVNAASVKEVLARKLTYLTTLHFK
ncbi:hypothetical protein [Rhodobacter capsulatus]|uniref:hypothetical protein n=1 Tax=Rhodobacter capsulatus TaxID=1061 RepID=UPI004028F0FE